MKDIVMKLQKLNKEIAVMESCTGGYIANAITNIEGASFVFKFGAVTYSNDYKVKMGVSEEVISLYSVYSMECANSMSKSIACYADSSYGIGVTGKLNREDVNNNTGDNNRVYISIYDRENDLFINKELVVTKESRLECKDEVLKEVIILLNKHIKASN